MCGLAVQFPDEQCSLEKRHHLIAVLTDCVSSFALLSGENEILVD